MSDIPSFHSHEPGPLFDDKESVDSMLGDLTHDLAHTAYQLEYAQRVAARMIEEGESFSLWLATELPDQFGGNNALDPLTAHEMLKLYQSRDNDTGHEDT